MSEVVLVRHGETEWSRSGQHTGKTDLPLTEDGEAQARTVVTRLAGREFALVLSSPMQRARRTAELAGYGERAEVDADLCERDYGEYEGLTTKEIRKTIPGWDVWRDEMTGGETLAQVGGGGGGGGG
jgi:broad specificity phosphatase PhoE